MTKSASNQTDSGSAPEKMNFIESAIQEDLNLGKADCVATRFPPEPNGYLHIGHAKSICLNFGLAQKFGGVCSLRFDDTNPAAEDVEFVDAIQNDVQWLGFQWAKLHFASDYFEQLYQWAVQLVRSGHAYVCDLDGEQTRQLRGTVTEPGKNSPFRDRTVDENIDLFQRMRAGEFPDGARTLRAKIDMSSPNLNLRDPVIYRILHTPHHRTGNTWCIYPTYDFAHGQCDSIEKVTFSICTLEFENHRPLYDWFCEKLEIFHPRQIEFARLNMAYTVMSKRKMIQLVDQGHVQGWDDPRMMTLGGVRRRGYTASSIRKFCEEIGVAKFNSVIDIVKLENEIRNELNRTAERRMAILDPIKLTITNWPEDQVETLEAVNNPENPDAGTRTVSFTRSLYIERADFREQAPRKYHRLKLGGAVRLRYAYIVDCQDIIKDSQGNIVEILCTYDPESRSGAGQSERKVKGTIHWVSTTEAKEAEVRLYDRLFQSERPDASDSESLQDQLNPNSLQIVTAKVEASLAAAEVGQRFQFERTGYFCVDPDSQTDRPVYNRIVSLRDSWSKIEAKGKSSS